MTQRTRVVGLPTVCCYHTWDYTLYSALHNCDSMSALSGQASLPREGRHCVHRPVSVLCLTCSTLTGIEQLINICPTDRGVNQFRQSMNLYLLCRDDQDGNGYEGPVKDDHRVAFKPVCVVVFSCPSAEGEKAEVGWIQSLNFSEWVWQKEDDAGFRAALKIEANGEGREIIRGVMDSEENSEAKGLVLTRVSRSRPGGAKE